MARKLRVGQPAVVYLVLKRAGSSLVKAARSTSIASFMSTDNQHVDMQATIFYTSLQAKIASFGKGILDKIFGGLNSKTRIGKTAAIGLAGLLMPYQANADSPLNDVPSSATPFSSITCTNYGTLTGAAGDIGSSSWVISTDDALLLMQGTNSIPSQIVDLGYGHISGVAIRDKDSSGNYTYAVSYGSTISEGKIDSTGKWLETKSIGVGQTPSGITDLDYALGHYFVSTVSDGIRRLESTDPVGNASTRLLPTDNGVCSLKVIDFTPGTYDNPLMQIEGISYNNIDTNGNFIDGSKICNLSVLTSVQGNAYFLDSSGNKVMALVYNKFISCYNGSDLPYVTNILSITSPTQDNPPNLEITKGDSVVLSWTTNSPDYHLESSTNIPFAWTRVTNTPLISGTNFVVEPTTDKPQEFFRLTE